MDSSSSIVVSSVQHVTKKSSDQLLRKFAEVGSDSGGGRRLLTVVKRRRTPVDVGGGGGGGGGEGKWLIPAAGRKSVVLLKKVGIGKSKQLIRTRDFRNKSLISAIHKMKKTWRRTVEGASKVLLEKHYNTHRRLISDIV